MKSDASKSYWSDPEPRKARIRASYDYAKRRKRTLQEEYGLTPEHYLQLFNHQEGKCAICGCSDSRHNMTNHLVVDHCHKTDSVRGLLCNNCNFLIGHAKDSIQTLLAAAKYLEKPPVKTLPPPPPISFSEPELQLLLRIFEDTGTLDKGGEIKDINDKVHEHYVSYLCSERQ